jgi:drug/metabolite transporter (DMT)-like permease
MLSTLMVVNALIAAVFGVAFVVLPGQVTALYGPEVTPQLEYVAQLFGAALLAFAVLTWTARTAPDSEARRAILLALFIGDGVGFVVSLIGQLSGVIAARPRIRLLLLRTAEGDRGSRSGHVGRRPTVVPG